MSANMKRMMICVTPEIEAAAEELKKNVFYNKPYSEVYRYLITEGLKSVNASIDQKKVSNEATI